MYFFHQKSSYKFLKLVHEVVHKYKQNEARYSWPIQNLVF